MREAYAASACMRRGCKRGPKRHSVDRRSKNIQEPVNRGSRVKRTPWPANRSEKRRIRRIGRVDIRTFWRRKELWSIPRREPWYWLDFQMIKLPISIEDVIQRTVANIWKTMTALVCIRLSGRSRFVLKGASATGRSSPLSKSCSERLPCKWSTVSFRVM